MFVLDITMEKEWIKPSLPTQWYKISKDTSLPAINIVITTQIYFLNISSVYYDFTSKIFNLTFKNLRGTDSSIYTDNYNTVINR